MRLSIKGVKVLSGPYSEPIRNRDIVELHGQNIMEVTCDPSRRHVHLRGVWLKHTVQSLLCAGIGCEVDGPENTAGQDTNE